MIRQILTTMAAACLAAAVMLPLHAQGSSRATSSGSGSAVAGLSAEPNPSGQYATSDLEDMRTQLLNLEDVLEQFAPFAPPNSVDLAALQQAKTRIQQMPYQHLNALRRGLSPSGMSGHITQARQHMRSYLASRAGGNATVRSQPSPQVVPVNPPAGFPVPNGICSPLTDIINSVGSQITSDGGLFGAFGGSGFDLGGSVSAGFGISGLISGDITLGGSISYTPGSASMDNIGNTGTATNYTQSLAYMRIPSAAVLAADAVWFVADSVREFSQDACGQDILGENLQLLCVVTDGLWVVAKAVDEGVHFCDDDLTESVGDSIYGGLALVYQDMYSVGNSLDTDLGNANTDIDTHIVNVNTNIDTNIVNANTDIDTHIGSVNTSIDNKIVNVDTDVDTKLTALGTAISQSNSQIMAQFTALTQAIQNIINCAKSPLTCKGTTGGGPTASAVPASVAPQSAGHQ